MPPKSGTAIATLYSLSFNSQALQTTCVRIRDINLNVIVRVYNNSTKKEEEEEVVEKKVKNV